MQATESLIIVQTTFPDEKSAKTISKELVTKKLTACAQIQAPRTSVYVWKEKLHEETEIPVSYKVSQEKHSEFRELLLSLHPYDVPQYYWHEAHCTPEYGKWVDEI